MKTKQTVSGKKQPIIVRDLNSKKNPNGGYVANAGGTVGLPIKDGVAPARVIAGTPQLALNNPS
jgi:hypothetical protein